MAKSATPYRLDAQLVDSARAMGGVLARTTVEQIEYWARIGKAIDATINPGQVTELLTGIATVRIEPKQSPYVNPDMLFSELDDQRTSGALSEAIACAGVRYQASIRCPGLLEQVSPDGTVRVGRFINGVFEAIAA
mgnify:FL=1|tara:strand:+ start:133 stop:540 length:408 start_codon:yes stop_codon:yes gene_type:complete